MKTQKRIIGILLSLALALGLMPGMNLTAYADVAVTKVSITATTNGLKVGETSTLAATIEPEDATNQTLKWSVSSGSTYVVRPYRCTA